MTPRIHLLVDGPEPRAALYAMRVLVEPMGFEVITDAEAPAAAGALVWSYGPEVPEVRAPAHLHVTSCDDFWSSWGQPASLPSGPYHRISATDLDLGGPATDSIVLPFLAEALKGEPPVARPNPGRFITRADIVASAFFFLTRYEEWLASERDAWGRVPEDRLGLVTEGLAHRAPVDEYREVLAGWLSRLLGRVVAAHPPGYEVHLTHDVDSGFCSSRGPFFRQALRGMARDVVRHRSPRTAMELGVNAIAAAAGRPIPFGNIGQVVRLSEQYGRTSHFFFMANGSHPDDATYDVRDPAVRRAAQTALDAGHRVGLHVGLDAAGDATALRREWDLLGEVIGREPTGARTHFLRWEPARTPGLLDAIGARLDSSAGFSTRCGFRTGTTRPHRLFDLESRRTLALMEYPLAIMDKAVYDLPSADRRDLVARVVSTVRRHGGCLTINWHYWYFTNRYRRICEEVLAACRDGRDATLA